MCNFTVRHTYKVNCDVKEKKNYQMMCVIKRLTNAIPNYHQSMNSAEFQEETIYDFDC